MTLKVFLTTEDKIKYPFLPEVQRYLDELGFTLDDLVGDFGDKIIERAAERVYSAIYRKNIPPSSLDYDLEIISFPVALLIVASINDDRLSERYAIVESKRVSKFLSMENSDKILYISNNVLGWNVIPTDVNIWGEKFSFKVHFKFYIKYAPEYRGRWKLINKPLLHGWVFITKHELVRLIENGIRELVKNKINKSKTLIPFIPAPLQKKIDKIKEDWIKQKKKIELKLTDLKSGVDAYPPCMKALIELQSQGKNLPHSARFALASFLINIGKSVDEVLEIFKGSPDFREDIARYQVEHIAGLRGSRTKYSPFKCDNMKALGLCSWECEKIKHPLQYFYLVAKGKKINVKKIQG